MRIIIGSKDSFLSNNLARMAKAEGLRVITTDKVERIISELKQIGRCAIIDMAWEEMQERGVLKQMVNIGRISGNQLVCMCPNQEEDLKKIGRNARADEVFIKHDMHTSFKEYLKELSVSDAPEAEKA